jgi:outer membrane protein insertion porin family
MSSHWKRARFSRTLAGRFARAAAAVATAAVVFACAFIVSARGAANAAARPVEVRGNRALSDGEIDAIVGARAGAAPDAVARALQTAYVERGYFSATIGVETAADSAIVLVVEEGEPARYGAISVRGPKSVSEKETLEVLGVRAGDRYDAGGLKNGFRRLLERYDEKGFPFAQVWVDSAGFDETAGTVSVSVYVIEGGAKTLGAVSFEGLERTRKDLAVKLSGLETGEPYDGGKIRDSYIRLSSSGVFDEVSYPEVRLSPDASGVEALFKVVEPKGKSSASAALGYADQEGTQDRVVSGLVRVDLANIGGTLRDLRFLWRNDGQGRSETRLSYDDRFFLGRRVGLGVTLEQVGLDTVYTWQSLGIESSVPVGRLGNGLFGVEAAVYGDRNTFSEGEVSNTLRLRLAAGVRFVEGHEDRGTLLDFHTRHTYARKDLNLRTGEAGGAVSQYIFEARLGVTMDATRNSHGAVEIVYRGIESDESYVPLSEQFYLGGAGTVRGYRENQFHGRRIAYARSELRLGKSRRENGYLFVDAGYVFEETEASDGAVTTGEEYPVGYGFGLRTESRVGNIDISFGIGEELSLQQTKVHVILNRRF